MARVTYAIVEHDGGWAYRVDGTFSETFPAARPRISPPAGRRWSSSSRATTAGITWEDERGRWHAEISSGGDRPEVDVED